MLKGRSAIVGAYIDWEKRNAAIGLRAGGLCAHHVPEAVATPTFGWAATDAQYRDVDGLLVADDAVDTPITLPAPKES